MTQLRRLAEAADSPGHIYTHPRDSNKWKANEEFHEACTPSRILKMLDVIDKAREVGVEYERLFGAQPKTVNAFRTSLAALDGEGG